MLTYKQLNELKEKLDRIPNEPFFTTDAGPYIYSFATDKPICSVNNKLYLEFFTEFDPVVLKEMVRYMLHLKKNHTYKRRK